MAVVFQALGTPISGTASVNVFWPTHVTGDIGILVVESCSLSLSAPSDWTLVAGAVSSAGLVSSTFVFWRRAASSAESSTATGFPADANHMAARIHTFRGCVTTGTPILTSATATRGSATTTWSAPSITTTTANEFVVWCAGRDNDSGVAQFGNPVNANLISPTEVGEVGTTFGNGGGFTVGYGVKATAGATGTTTGTVTSSAGASVTFSLQEQPNAYVLTADKGTYSFTGNAATLKRGVVLVSDSGNFTETGNAASLNRGFKLASSAGAFNEDGNNAELATARLVTGSTGVFSFTGNAATFTKTTASKILLADVGAFTSTGNDAGLQATRKATAASGAFTLTGNATTFGLTYAIQCSPSAFAVTGADARVFKTKRRLINF